MAKSFFFVVLAIVLLAAARAICSEGQSDARRQLMIDLVASLNDKSDAALEAFVRKNCDATTPVDTRVSRMKSLAANGAPFKLVRLMPDSPGEIGAIVTNKNSEALGFRIILSDGAELKIKGMRVGPPEDVDAGPPKDYSNWQDLPSLAESLRVDTKNPAIGIAVIRDGKLEQTVKGTRKTDGQEPVGVDEPWSIGSIGKPICSTIIGRLIEMGKLRWDETLAEAFPDLPMKPGYRIATIEQVMHHRGGVPADPGMRRADVDRIVAGSKDPRQIRLNYAKDILQRDPIAKPGERFEYSNAGYALLGAIAERAMGKPYERLVREMIFAPLHLTHSYTSEDKLPTNRPSGYLRGPNGLQEANFAGPMEILYAPAGGGQFMSVADLARFGQMHLEGLLGKDGLLKASTIQRLHQGEAEDSPEGRKYACGWGIEKFPGIETMHTHNGSNGTMRAQVAIFPGSKVVVASFVNAGGESEPSPPLQAILAVARRFAKAP